MLLVFMRLRPHLRSLGTIRIDVHAQGCPFDHGFEDLNVYLFADHGEIAEAAVRQQELSAEARLCVVDFCNARLSHVSGVREAVLPYVIAKLARKG